MKHYFDDTKYRSLTIFRKKYTLALEISIRHDPGWRV